MNSRSSSGHALVKAALILPILAMVLAPIVYAGSSPNGDTAAAWPSSWTAYTYANGTAISDPTGVLAAVAAAALGAGSLFGLSWSRNRSAQPGDAPQSHDGP